MPIFSKGMQAGTMERVTEVREVVDISYEKRRREALQAEIDRIDALLAEAEKQGVDMDVKSAMVP